MTERTRQKSPDDAEAKARDAAFESWNPGAPAAEEPPPEVLFKPPRAKISFPPSSLLILAGACVLFALEPTFELGYELFGPSRTVDLGAPAAYTMGAAKDNIPAHIKGYLGSIVQTVEPWGANYEVGVLKGAPVLVRRTRHPTPPKDTVQIYEGEGRLIQLEGTPSTFFERLVEPTARFNTLRLQYEALGELSPNQPAYLLVEGDLPRAHPGRIAQPIVLWVLAVVFSMLAWRSYAVRSAAAHRRRI